MIKISYSKFFNKYIVESIIDNIIDARWKFDTNESTKLDDIIKALKNMGYNDNDIKII